MRLRRPGGRRAAGGNTASGSGRGAAGWCGGATAGAAAAGGRRRRGSLHGQRRRRTEAPRVLPRAWPAQGLLHDSTSGGRAWPSLQPRAWGSRVARRVPFFFALGRVKGAVFRRCAPAGLAVSVSRAVHTACFAAPFWRNLSPHASHASVPAPGGTMPAAPRLPHLGRPPLVWWRDPSNPQGRRSWSLNRTCTG